MSRQEPTYLELIAQDIWQECGGTTEWYFEGDEALYLAYALLATTKGLQTTVEDVHNAWALWSTISSNTAVHPNHHSNIPFWRLSPAVQALDAPYRDAIHRVVKRAQDGPATVTGAIR